MPSVIPSSFSHLCPRSPAILDGGMGTTLEDVFSLPVSHTALWSAKPVEDNPEKMIEAHKAFMNAGADILLTATYQCSFDTFTRAGYSNDDAERIMRKAVSLAKQAKANTSTLVALSLGPLGASLSPAQEFDGYYPPPYGPKAFSEFDKNINTYQDETSIKASVQALREWHGKRLGVFMGDADTWSAIDCLAFETIPLTREIMAIRRAISDIKCHKPWWVSLVFPGGSFSEHAKSVKDVVHALYSNEPGQAYPQAIGINCTQIEFYPRLLTEIETAIQEMKPDFKPWLVLYPNGGDTYDPVAKTWRDNNTKGGNWARQVAIVCRDHKEAWEGLIVGGCCRTGPEEIRSLTTLLRS